jgi:MFS family permease
LFTVQHSTDSFATAGAAVAAFGLASLSMPFKARLVDRHSQRRVLPVLAALCAAGLAAIAFLGTTNAAGPALVILAGVAGLLAPPLGPSMRSNWRLITDQSQLKERAYALDSIAEESLYLGGPLIAGVVISLWSASGALLCTAALIPDRAVVGLACGRSAADADRADDPAQPPQHRRTGINQYSELRVSRRAPAGARPPEPVPALRALPVNWRRWRHARTTPVRPRGTGVGEPECSGGSGWQRRRMADLR